MSDYPGAIDTFREVENLPGLEYDPARTKTLFAEDVNALAEAVEAIENTLGINPQGGTATVNDRLVGIESEIGTLISSRRIVGISVNWNNPFDGVTVDFYNYDFTDFVMNPIFVAVWKNGLLLTNGVDYTITFNLSRPTITFAVAPILTDVVALFANVIP